MLTPVAGNAPGHQQGLFGSVSAQRLKDRIHEQILHGDVGQVSADKVLVVGPEPVGDLRNSRLGNQRSSGGIAEGVFHIAGGQPARIHFADQPLEHLAVAVKKAHQRRPKRFFGTTDLRQRHVERALRGAHPSGLIPITRARLALPTALIATPPTQKVGLLSLHQLLHDHPGHRLHQRGHDVRPMIGPTGQQLLQLLPSNL
jgi:hypothetical protein